MARLLDADDLPCPYRGEAQGTVEPTRLCGCDEPQTVYGCEKFQQCSIRRVAKAIQSCLQCDWLPAAVEWRQSARTLQGDGQG